MNFEAVLNDEKIVDAEFLPAEAQPLTLEAVIRGRADCPLLGSCG